MAENNLQPELVAPQLPAVANNALPVGNGLPIREVGNPVMPQAPAPAALKGKSSKAAAPKAGPRVKPGRVVNNPAAVLPKDPPPGLAPKAPPGGRQAARANVSNAPAVVQVQNPPPLVEVKRRFASFLEAANAWAPLVSPDSEVFKYVKSLGVAPRVPLPTEVFSDTNQHPRQAAERGLATARAFGMLYASNKRRIAGIYGSPRDEKIVDFCNAQSHAKAGDRMEYVRYNPIVTPKDASRAPTVIPFVEVAARADNFLLVDIYDSSIGTVGPLTPAGIASMLEYLPDPFGGLKVTWIGRKFYGSAGLVADEGGWYRRGNKIVFRSSLREPQEYVHDPLDWLWKSGSANVFVHGQPSVLSWYLAKTVGTFYIINFNLTLGIVDCNQEVDLFEYDDQLVMVDCPTSNPFVSWLCPMVNYVPSFARKLLPIYEKQPLYLPLYEAARMAAQSRRYNQVNFTRVSSALIAAAGQPAAKLFLGLFPRFVLRKNFNAVVWGIFLDDVDERRISTRTAVVSHSEHMAEINDLQARIGAPPSPVMTRDRFELFLKIFSVLSCIFLAWRFRQRWNARKAAMNALACSDSLIVSYPLNCFLPQRIYLPAGTHPLHQLAFSLVGENIMAPIHEETVKRLHRYVGGWLFPSWMDFACIFPIIEFVSSFRDAHNRLPPSQKRAAFLLRFPALLMHLFANRLSWSQAVLVHILWNSVGARLWLWAIREFYGSREAMVWGATACSFHWMSRRLLPLFAGGFSLALLWRFAAKWLVKTRPNFYPQWKKTYFEDDWTDRVIYESDESFVEDIDDPRVPEQVSGLELTSDMRDSLYPVPGINTKDLALSHCFVPSNSLPERSGDIQPTYFYHLLPTCAPGFVPKVCHVNMAVAVGYRLLVPPFMHPKTQEASWRKRFAVNRAELRCFFPEQPESLALPWTEVVDEWVEHFNSPLKRRSYRQVVENLKIGAINFQIPENTELFVKHDEMLMQQDRSGLSGCYQLKPRIIANVCPEFQAMVGPYVYMAQKAMGAHFSMDERARLIIDFETGKVPPTYFHIASGGGKTDVELSKWMNRVLEHYYIPDGEFGFCILASGDDSVVAQVNCDGTVVFYEGDASKFDQSESFGPLKAETTMLTWLGMDMVTAHKVFQMAQVRYVVKSHSNDGDQPAFVLNREKRPIRDTGGPNTYLGNTLIMLSAWYMVIRSIQREQWLTFTEDPMSAIFSEFAHLGFEMKIQRHLEPDDVTFLKGMWYDSDMEYYWGPLPSRILKAGKSLHDPRSLYGVSSFPRAGHMFLCDVASSYRVFLQVPVLRAFVKRFEESLEKPAGEARISEYATQASGELSGYVISAVAISAVCRRYNCSPEDLRRVETMISNAKALQFLHDPVFLRLAEVDYA